VKSSPLDGLHLIQLLAAFLVCIDLGIETNPLSLGGLLSQVREVVQIFVKILEGLSLLLNFFSQSLF
jgi:hypothetical protein